MILSSEISSNPSNFDKVEHWFNLSELFNFKELFILHLNIFWLYFSNKMV